MKWYKQCIETEKFLRKPRLRDVHQKQQITKQYVGSLRQKVQRSSIVKADPA